MYFFSRILRKHFGWKSTCSNRINGFRKTTKSLFELHHLFPSILYYCYLCIVFFILCVTILHYNSVVKTYRQMLSCKWNDTHARQYSMFLPVFHQSTKKWMPLVLILLLHTVTCTTFQLIRAFDHIWFEQQMVQLKKKYLYSERIQWFIYLTLVRVIRILIISIFRVSY